MDNTFLKIVDLLSKNKCVLAFALGGSRSRNEHHQNSDYDIFCVIKDDRFTFFRRTFSRLVESQIDEIVVFVEMYYLENWGYLFKGFDNSGTYYDISIIPRRRIDEISIRNSNKVLYDTDNVYSNAMYDAEDAKYNVCTTLNDKIKDYEKMFYVDAGKFIKSYYSKDYWLMVRYLERLKRLLIMRLRYMSNIPPASLFAPEKNMKLDMQNSSLKRYYIIDGNTESLLGTAKYMLDEFQNTLHDDSVLSRTIKIHDRRSVFQKKNV